MDPKLCFVQGLFYSNRKQIHEKSISNHKRSNKNSIEKHLTAFSSEL